MEFAGAATTSIRPMSLPVRPSLTLVGRSRPICDVRRQVARAATSGAVVLLSGESGTGKGLAARLIHNESPRALAPFVSVNCAAIPHGVFESELFGHVRGAFTGAVETRRGLFELADAGTLFLDEIGELPLSLQPKLLRVLEDRTFLRVGGSTPLHVDIRIIAATNRNLRDMVARGEFREDLSYRLRVIEIEMPPLRARRDDVALLVAELLPRIARRNHRALPVLADDALSRLASYDWPGNVRELENILERALVLSTSNVLHSDDLALPSHRFAASPTAPRRISEVSSAVVPLITLNGHRSAMEEIERTRILATLRDVSGNQSRAARALGLPRTTLINKMRRLGITALIPG